MRSGSPRTVTRNVPQAHDATRVVSPDASFIRSSATML